MDSSSDNSFLWTDASSDSISGDSDTMVVNKHQSESESESGKTFKKKLQEELFSKNNYDAVSKKQNKSKKKKLNEHTSCNDDSDNLRHNQIKSEPASDIDLPGIETESHHCEANGLKNGSHQDSMSTDESYANLEIKKELTPAKSSKKLKKHKIKNQMDIDSDNQTDAEISFQKHKDITFNILSTDIEDEECIKQEQTEDCNSSKTKKKKKKSKKRQDSIDTDSKNTTPEDKSIMQEHLDGSESPLKFNSSQNYEDMDQDTKSGVRQDNYQSNQIESDVTHNLKWNSFSKNLKKEHIPRISDKVQFEDDEYAYSDSELETSIATTKTTLTQSSMLKKFLKSNTNLKPVLQRLPKNVTVSSDDDIWVIQGSKDIDIKAFQDISLAIEDKFKIKLDGQTYEGNQLKENRKIAMLTMEEEKFIIKNFVLKGSINLHKRLPKLHIQADNSIVNNQTFIPLPDTKCRHPLFGAHYKKAMKVPAVVAARLKQQDFESLPNNCDKARKKLKKEKRKSVYCDIAEVSLPSVKLEANTDPEPMDQEPTLSAKKKKRKRKHTDNEETSKKAKRVKHDPESAEAWESEKAIEENLFNF